MYTAEVKLPIQRVGDYLTTVTLVHNDSNIIHVTYNTFGGNSDQIAIDNHGNVTLKKKFT